MYYILLGMSGGVALGWAHLIGGITSFLVSLGAIRLLLALIRRGHLSRFAPYCFVAGLLALVWGLAQVMGW